MSDRILLWALVVFLWGTLAVVLALGLSWAFA
jgi:hypothetical protein